MEQYFLKLDSSKNIESLSIFTLSNIKLFYTQFTEKQFITAEEANSIGFVPFLFTDKPVPKNIFETEYVEVNPTEKNSSGYYIQKYELRDIQFETDEQKSAAETQYISFLKSQIKEKLNLIRLHKEHSGFTFDFENGGSGTIQTRNYEDVRNIQNLILHAQFLVNDGETEVAFTFKDAENVMHEMTPQEMLKLGVALQQFITSTYRFVWTLKDTVSDLTSKSELESFLEKLGEYNTDCQYCN